MTMPGFTAEASLYRTTEDYKMVGVSALASAAEVVPQGLFCFSKTFGVGPVSLTVKCCAVPPGCRITGCAFGICKSFCVGACP